MKEKRLLYTICAFLLSGNAFFFSGCDGRVADGVIIDGIAVGGMEYAEAISAVRERLRAEISPLVVHTPLKDYTLSYPTLDIRDDLPILVRLARSGNELQARWQRVWVNMEEEARLICEQNAVESVDATLTFTAEGFTYFPERTGRACDYAGFLTQVNGALSEGKGEVSLPVRTLPPAVTEEDLRQKTTLLSEFTTYFDGENAPRVNNIKLSASRISGIILQAGEEFSFNGTVGLRTEENGYESATVIQDGVFTDGIGGGVCQTSTTLFNAALLAGMEITESRNHSLTIGYVPPSLDAMVSEYSDLKFRNPSPEAVYLLAKVEGEGITFRFYGLPSGSFYKTESVTLEVVSPLTPQLIEGESEKVVRPEKKGLKSESYLLRYDGLGNLQERTLIRRDSYNPVQGIYQILPE